MFTIFSTPKDFKGKIKIIQKNAFSNWRSLSDDIEIIIMGTSYGAKDAAKRINAKFIKDVPSSANGVPTIPGLFEAAEKNAENEILCYVNADIILPKKIIESIRILSQQNNNFLAIGHRWDIEYEKLIDFKNIKDSELFWSIVKTKSSKHACTGIDYFIFKKNTFKKLPDLLVGRIGWDNWLLWKARRMFLPLIDISDDIKVVHQNHNSNFERDDQINKKVLDNKVLNILDANFYLSKGEIKKKNTEEFFNRNLGKLPIIFFEFAFLLIPLRKLYRIFKK